MRAFSMDVTVKFFKTYNDLLSQTHITNGDHDDTHQHCDSNYDCIHYFWKMIVINEHFIYMGI